MSEVTTEHRQSAISWFISSLSTCAIHAIMIACNQGRSQRGLGALPPPPNRRLCGVFYGIKNWLCWGVGSAVLSTISVMWASNMAKNALAAGAPPWTPLVVFTTLPRPCRRLGMGTFPPKFPPPRRLGRQIDFRAFVAQLPWPPM